MTNLNAAPKPSRGLVVLVSNTSWYLYNFRRGTICALRAAGFSVVELSPTDPFSQRLEDELGVRHQHLNLDGKGTSVLGEGRSFVGLALTLRRMKPAFVFNFTVKANIYSGLACRALGIAYANNRAAGFWYGFNPLCVFASAGWPTKKFR